MQTDATDVDGSGARPLLAPSPFSHNGQPPPRQGWVGGRWWVLLLVGTLATLAFLAHSFTFAANVATTSNPKTPPTTSATDVALLSAHLTADPLAAYGGRDIIVSEGALVPSGNLGEDVITQNSHSAGAISLYEVREADTLSQIAEMFDVNVNTILWANDLPPDAVIKPGDTLVILPIVGVRHVVKDGDTIAALAKKYGGDVAEIVSYNQLATADAIAIGDTVVIPGGSVKHATPARRAHYPTPTRVSGRGAVVSNLTHPAPGAVRTQGLHGYNAVDLAAGHGSAVYAAAAGEVIVSKVSGWNGGYGSYIVIRHGNGTQTLYAHLSRNDVGVGAVVASGEVIGGMGNTGRSTGTHLHFEVRGAVNPF